MNRNSTLFLNWEILLFDAVSAREIYVMKIKCFTFNLVFSYETNLRTNMTFTKGFFIFENLIEIPIILNSHHLKNLRSFFLDQTSLVSYRGSTLNQA